MAYIYPSDRYGETQFVPDVLSGEFYPSIYASPAYDRLGMTTPIGGGPAGFDPYPSASVLLQAAPQTQAPPTGVGGGDLYIENNWFLSHMTEQYVGVTGLKVSENLSRKSQIVRPASDSQVRMGEGNAVAGAVIGESMWTKPRSDRAPRTVVHVENQGSQHIVTGARGGDIVFEVQCSISIVCDRFGHVLDAFSFT